MGVDGCCHARIDVDSFSKWIFNKYCVKQYGSLFYDEFYKFCRDLWTMHERPQLETEMVFAMFDFDRDEVLRIGEFAEVYAFFAGNRLSKSTLDALWTQITTDCCIQFTNADRQFMTREQYFRWLYYGNRIVHEYDPIDDEAANSTDSRAFKTPHDVARAHCRSVTAIRIKEMRRALHSKTLAQTPTQHCPKLGILSAYGFTIDDYGTVFAKPNVRPNRRKENSQMIILSRARKNWSTRIEH